MLDHGGGTDWTVAVWSPGRVDVQFRQLARAHGHAARHPFADEGRRLELLRRLNAVPGVAIPPAAIAGLPGVPLAVLAEPGPRGEFLRVLDWLVGELRTTATA